MRQAVVSLENLKYYHKLLMKTIDAKIELSTMKRTNCPNCGAVILAANVNIAEQILKRFGCL